MSDPTTNAPADTADSTASQHTAGAFDIRNIIGALLGLYGVILTLAGLLGAHEPEKTGGVNANLWTGLVLAAAAAVFLVWARLKPIVVPAHVEPAQEDATRPGPRRHPGGH
ncbi:hypothetical protein [Pedococcus sp. 5OH_020]|uniref:hypothetical protein n=1 Tax=Pedococcus sp. 5OH_020 TaxID=2989814 RepID=UPI0022E99F0D|nr:hypothetical protein [Pedococcus sp. 5OH_020]